VTWFTDANCAAAALRENAMLAYAVDLDFPSGHVRITTWKGGVSILGNTFVPGFNEAGDILVAMKEPIERAQLYAETWTYQLAGVDVSVIPESELDNSYGRSVTEYEVWFDPETRAMIGYEIRREGTISKPRRRDGAEPLIEIDVEHRLVILEDADLWRFTGQHQDKFFPTGTRDEGCDLTASLESKEVIWGGKRVEAGGAIRNVIRNSVRG
jgi:hypothetical protein